MGVSRIFFQGGGDEISFYPLETTKQPVSSKNINRKMSKF